MGPTGFYFVLIGLTSCFLVGFCVVEALLPDLVVATSFFFRCSYWLSSLLVATEDPATCGSTFALTFCFVFSSNRTSLIFYDFFFKDISGKGKSERSASSFKGFSFIPRTR